MKITLKAMRINKGLTQKEASKILGIAENTLLNYENYKKYPDTLMVEKILKLYDCNYDDIIFLPQKSDFIAKNDEEV